MDGWYGIHLHILGYGNFHSSEMPSTPVRAWRDTLRRREIKYHSCTSIDILVTRQQKSIYSFKALWINLYWLQTVEKPVATQVRDKFQCQREFRSMNIWHSP